MVPPSTATFSISMERSTRNAKTLKARSQPGWMLWRQGLHTSSSYKIPVDSLSCPFAFSCEFLRHSCLDMRREANTIDISTHNEQSSNLQFSQYDEAVVFTVMAGCHDFVEPMRNVKKLILLLTQSWYESLEKSQMKKICFLGKNFNWDIKELNSMCD